MTYKTPTRPDYHEIARQVAQHGTARRQGCVIVADWSRGQPERIVSTGYNARGLSAATWAVLQASREELHQPLVVYLTEQPDRPDWLLLRAVGCRIASWPGGSAFLSDEPPTEAA